MTGKFKGFSVAVERGSLLALGTQPSGPIRLFYLRLMARIDANAKRKLSGEYLNVRTGNLRSSQAPPFIVAGPESLLGVVENIASYAAALHQGSAPHEIRPRNRKMLKFDGADGAPVFCALVNHLGTKPRPWLRDALIEELARVT